jgi:hypothetical protein
MPMLMDTLISRVKASLLLTPAILLLFVWIARFASIEEMGRMGSVVFLTWALATAFAISYIVTLYVSLVMKLTRQE